ncbi:unnamed protein product [Prunus armeniaca]|uniref:Uncharacterized protein n=1 Tax=Prunus armeniaca TaxID=36596 RepID=A0A6J5VAI3_PRUAR|nr:unnamed protein product [Prunus armeniaca]
MIVATNHQNFCPPSEPVSEKGKAASEGSGFARPKALIFVQMKRNLVKEVPSASLVVRLLVGSILLKRSQPEEFVSGGDVCQAQPETTQGKWARTSPAKTPQSSPATLKIPRIA